VREYVEERAFIRVVVSLPQETFYSSGASVKASLLFLQKFTEQEQAEFDEKKAEARAEVEAKYRDEIAARVAAFEADIEAAKNDKQRRADLAKALKDYRREMDVKIDREARALLKERFAYCIFLYDAEKVGITATGEDDQNELYPNANVPSGVQKTCLELYREFCRHPESFLLEEEAA
jgi:type I restriction enzyme M protein